MRTYLYGWAKQDTRIEDYMTSATEVLFGHAAPIERSFRNKIIGFMTLNRIALNILALPAVIGVTALAGGNFNDSRLPILFIIVLLMFIAGNITNDIADSERDRRKWPLRPLASGLISKSMATFYVIMIAGIALLLAGVVYNWLCAALWLSVLVLSYVYSRYARDKIGHLTVLIPEVFIPVAIWAAISPGTMLTPLLWIIVAILAAGGAALNFTNESFFPEVKALVVQPRPYVEMGLYATCVLICFSAGTAIFFYAKLSWMYMLVLIALTMWALWTAKCLGEQRSPEMAKKAYVTWAAQVTFFILSITLFSWIK
ncbi:MAG TPA: UbiA family prenyltransferase [Candidatus Acidoferrales bacterium]|nr:UbiA family prenyltransferase [Candidatus Acidoferrales bacterium]